MHECTGPRPYRNTLGFPEAIRRPVPPTNHLNISRFRTSKLRQIPARCAIAKSPTGLLRSGRPVYYTGERGRNTLAVASTYRENRAVKKKQKGSPMVSLRIPADVLAAIVREVDRSMLGNRGEPYDRSSFILSAIKEKLAHRERSRKGRGRKPSAADTSAADGVEMVAEDVSPSLNQ